MRKPLLAAVALFFAHSAIAQQEVHKWVDENGVVHYGERAPSGVKTQKIEIQPSPAPTDRATPSSRSTNTPRGSGGRPRINVTTVAEDSEAICSRARVEFEILIEQRPVYRTEDGELRIPWAADTYKGPRHYLDDETRQREIDQAVQDVVDHCEDPLDAEMHQEAWDQSRNSDLCALAEQDYQDALRPSSRSTDEYIAERRRRVKEHCGK